MLISELMPPFRITENSSLADFLYTSNISKHAHAPSSALTNELRLLLEVFFIFQPFDLLHSVLCGTMVNHYSFREIRNVSESMTHEVKPSGPARACFEMPAPVVAKEKDRLDPRVYLHYVI